MRRLFALLFALVALPAFAKDTLHLYNWNNYIAPETIKRFEETCKCDVVQTYYSDNEELLAKLAAGAKGYDILVPTSNAVQALIKGGQLKPIDKSQLPNLKNIEARYLNTPFDPDNKYSVPYAMSTTILGYNDEKMKELALPTDTWAVIFDPKYLEKVKGRVTVLDSSSELFAAAFKYLGYSANDVDPKHWDEAAALMKKAKPYWAAFNASSYIKELTVGNIWLVHGYSNDIFQANLDAQAAGRKFKVLQGMPKEGAVLAVDNMVIHKSAPRPDLAHKFINFMLEGKNSAELTNLIGSGNPNADALKYIKPEIQKNTAIFPDKAVQAKLEQLQELTTAQRRLRNKLWTEIKAGEMTLDGTAGFTVERLTPARRDDFLRFMDHERGSAFADNPKWAKCYCHFYHVPKAIVWGSLDATANRTAMTARIDAGEMEGFLAYAAGETVGWLNGQPYPKLAHACARLDIAAPPLDVEPHEAAAIVCFVVAPAWRRRGVASALLIGALRSFVNRGIRVVDAFPFKSGDSVEPAHHYHGPLSLFLDAGFSVLREETEMTIVRKRLD